MNVYPAILRYDRAYGGYSVLFPDLPYSTCGKTPEEAYLMACDLLRIWLEEPNPLGGHVPPTPFKEVKKKRGDIVLLVHPMLYEGGDAE